MGRHTSHPNGAIRGNLEPDREVRRALKGYYIPAFGIRRMLLDDDMERVTDITFGMQDENDIPIKVELRDRLAVTLLSQRVIGAQMMRGFVAAHSLDRARHRIANSNGCSEWRNPVTVSRNDVEVFQGRTVFARIKSDEVESEISDIHKVLGNVGIRGIARREKPFVPHMTLGQTAKSDRLSHTEERHVIHMLEDQLPESLQLYEWDVYPDDVFEPNR